MDFSSLESVITSLSSETPRPLRCYSMTMFGMNQRFGYNISVSGDNEINALMPAAIFRFTIRVFSENAPVPELLRSSILIPSQTFFQEGSDFLRTLLSPLSSYRIFDTNIIETIVNVAVDEIQEIFQVDDAAASSSESQPPEVPLWIVINATDNTMRAATQNPFRTVPASEEAINTLVKKSTVLQSESCCCVCLDEFDVNAECYTLPCQHFFHHKCIFQWLHTNHTCPMCRYPLPE